MIHWTNHIDSQTAHLDNLDMILVLGNIGRRLTFFFFIAFIKKQT